jgi:endonuclease VIII
MPEGHTVHRNARDHQKLFKGQIVEVTSPQGRFAGCEDFPGSRFVGAEAYGKHEFLRFDNERLIHIHLGLFGKFRVHRLLPAPEPVGAVRLRIVGAIGAIDLSGPTACASGDDALYKSITARLGPDPLRPDAEVDRFLIRVAKSKTTIGQLLMDQAVIAGVGNVYRAEALFVNNIWPERAGRDLSDAEREVIWTTTVSMLKAGVKAGKIITIAKDDPDLPASARAADKRTYVYKRDHCLRCGTAIRRWDMAGRWCYACPTCQPR